MTQAMTVVQQPVALAPRTLEEGNNLAKLLAASTLIPEALRGKPGDVMVVLMTGAELGLQPMQALRSIAVVKGKAVMSAELLVALVQRSPACEYFRLKESTPEKAVYVTQRRGHPEPVEMAWTMADATRAGLSGSNTYKAHPSAMLRARCSAALVRAVYPDLALGFMVEEEAEEVRDRDQRRHKVQPPMLDAESPLPPAPNAEDVAAQDELFEQGMVALSKGLWEAAGNVGKQLTGQHQAQFKMEWKRAKAAAKVAEYAASVQEREPGSDDEEIPPL